MKKFVFGIIFTFLTMSIFGQIPSVVVSNFTSRARDVHEDDLVTVMEMFMNTLASGRTVNVVDRTVLERTMTAIEFGAGDWSNSVKTTQLGEELNAIYIVSGTMTQLGTSLTFSISVRDIKTLAVIASDQKQYTLENVWDNLVGIPAQLSDMGSAISRGIDTEQNKRNQEKQAQLAQEEAGRRAQLVREEEERALVGTWLAGSSAHYIKPPSGSYYNAYGGESNQNDSYTLVFRNNGTFTLTHLRARRYPTGDYTGRNNFEQNEYSGTYVRDGNNLRLTWTMDQYWFIVETDRRGNNLPTRDGNKTSSGNSTYTINFSRNSSGTITELSLNGGSPFGRSYNK